MKRFKKTEPKIDDEFILMDLKNNKHQLLLKRILKSTVRITILLLISLITYACKKNSDPVKDENNYTPEKPDYSIATFNIRRTTNADTDNRSWSVRRPHVATLIKTYSFDIFGIQEPIGAQIDNMVADLPEYDRFGVSDHNDYAYQHQDIFYKKAKFALLTSGKFWLAPDGPEVPPSDTTPWDNYYHSEVVTWGKFQDKSTGFEFYIFNAHFEPGAPVAQLESAKLILSKVAIIAGNAPVMFMGDLNTNQTSEPYNILQASSLFKDSYTLASEKYPVNTPTFNNWNISPSGDSRIDHIFISQHFKVHTHQILTNNYNKVLPSDHFPVAIGISRVNN